MSLRRFRGLSLTLAASLVGMTSRWVGSLLFTTTLLVLDILEEAQSLAVQLLGAKQLVVHISTRRAANSLEHVKLIITFLQALNAKTHVQTLKQSILRYGNWQDNHKTNNHDSFTGAGGKGISLL